MRIWRLFFRIERRRREMPALIEVEPGHKLACFNPET